jgi:hypothetical protein
MGMAKAVLETETHQRIEVQFNPAELTIAKRVQWGGGDARGANAPQLRFQSGQPATMTLTLVLDATGGGTPVGERVDALLKLVTVDKNLPSSDRQRQSARPPSCVLRWGSIQSFAAVVDSLTVKYTFFADDGTPLRARCDLSLKQFKDDEQMPRQNPTSGTPFPHTIHHLLPGETLDRLAARYYRDPTRWRLIADANGVDDPTRPPVGRPLVVPELPVQRRG